MDLLLLDLDPIAFTIGSIKVRWYGILIATGIVIAYFVAQLEGQKRGLPKDFFADLLIWAIPISIICARIYYVVMEWDSYSGNFAKMIAIWEGGIAIHGALIGAISTAYVFCRKKGISFLKVADIAAPSILIGQIVGRWGNFMNQEAYGGPVSEEFIRSLMLPDWIINQMYINDPVYGLSYFHPTFLYESMWNLLGLILLLVLRKVNLHRGEIFFSYIIWYSVGRVFIESLRTDSLYLFGLGLKTAQVVSVLGILIGVTAFTYRRLKVRPVVRYKDR